MAEDSAPRLRSSDSVPVSQRRPPFDRDSHQVDVEDVELPEELVRDEADREMLLQMTEVEREVELAERAEKQRREDERQKLLEQPEATAEGKEGKEASKEQLEESGETSSDEELTFASQTGTPTAKREPKGEESGSEKEEEISDVDAKEAVENEAEFEDYLAAQILRSDLERWIAEPHFEESVLGCFVRLHGNGATRADSSNRNEYMMVEVTDCQTKDDILPYKFGPLNKTTRFQLQLRRGVTEFWSCLDVISNSEFTEKEFQEWVQACKRHQRPLPSKEEMEDRRLQIEQGRSFRFTNAEVKKILEEKRKQGSLRVSNVMQRAHFMRLRDYHRDQNDIEKVQEYDAKIKELEAKAAERKGRSLGVVDREAVAREKQIRAETLEAQIELRRVRIQEKFEKKLARLPPHRRPKAMYKFYGPNHPLCANFQESDIQLPFLQSPPSPELDPLPQDILMEPDLLRDFSGENAEALRAGFKRVVAEQVADTNDILCQDVLQRWEPEKKRVRKELGDV